MLQAGDSAPPFSLPDADMAVFDLAAQRGAHHVVLYFYPRDKTPGCTQLACDFSDHEEAFGRHGCIIVGVSPDDCLTHAEFRDEQGLSVRLLSDEDREVCGLFGVLQSREVDGHLKQSVSRATFIIDKQGIIRHVLRDVSPRGHVAEVFNLVRKLDTETGN